jgi:hypothetical protein
MDNHTLEFQRQIERTDILTKAVTATIIAVGFLIITFIAFAIGTYASYPF